MNFYRERLQKIQGLLKEKGLDGLYLTSQPNIYYLTGIPAFADAKEMYALIRDEKITVFVNSTYFPFAKKAHSDAEIVELTYSNDLTGQIKTYTSSYKTIGFESEDLTVSILDKLKNRVSEIEWVPTTNVVEQLRQIKDADEIENIAQAAQITDDAFLYIQKYIKPGVSEKDVALELEFYLRKHAGGIAFAPIVASGPNAANPHHTPNETRIKENQMVLLDYGAKVHGYCADLTRMVYVGTPDEAYKKRYAIVLEAQKKALDFLESSKKETEIAAKDVDKVARDYIEAQGYALPHGLGHCLGLDIHEHPRLSPLETNSLKPGMAFTVEPGIYIEGWGGIRIEDLIVWDPTDGMKLLSKANKVICSV